MNNRKLPVCPYCGKQVSYFEAFLIKDKEKYFCENCKNISKIRIKSDIYKRIWASEFTAVAIVILYLLVNIRPVLLGVISVMIPFLVFYAGVPFMVYLDE